MAEEHGLRVSSFRNTAACSVLLHLVHLLWQKARRWRVCAFPVWWHLLDADCLLDVKTIGCAIYVPLLSNLCAIAEQPICHAAAAG
jgi:hypothetical protein